MDELMGSLPYDVAVIVSLMIDHRGQCQDPCREPG